MSVSPEMSSARFLAASPVKITSLSSPDTLKIRQPGVRGRAGPPRKQGHHAPAAPARPPRQCEKGGASQSGDMTMVPSTTLAAFAAVALGMALTPGPNMAYL